ncbi:MAG: hypothetical protein KAS32_20630 [Candidatus Peribacteraceae bacterium]|nr:hypothetical protein [Candidatus Peribacteraceae bacterium]
MSSYLKVDKNMMMLYSDLDKKYNKNTYKNLSPKLLKRGATTLLTTAELTGSDLTCLDAINKVYDIINQTYKLGRSEKIKRAGKEIEGMLMEYIKDFVKR